MSDEGFNSVSIIGVGLIGGSLALALREKGLAKHIIGYGRDENRLKEAMELGIIDSFTLSLKESAEAELIVLATPIGVFEKITKEISPFLKAETIIIDVGSVKKQIIDTIESLIPENVYFIGTHPIAGSDKTGFENAKVDLFKGAKVIITPADKTQYNAMLKISDMWQQIGASVEFMSAEEHDRIYALVSHLPHLLSFSLVNTVAKIDENLIDYAGSGFRDTTRIAKSSSELWRDIFLMNKSSLFEMVNAFMKILEEVKDLISQEKAHEIEQFLEKARKLRKKIDKC